MTTRDLTALLLVILGVVALLPALWMSLGGVGMMGPGMMGQGGPAQGGWGGGFGGAGVLMLLLLAAGVVLVVLGLSRRETRSGEALEILKRRLASGEITREQYEEHKRVLDEP